jgi:class I fructose-bisphosphate aldolase
MGLGKQIRLNRIFAHPSGNLCSVAIDHFIGYNMGLPPGLRHMKDTLSSVMDAKPDAVTMHKGIATSLWSHYAGQAPLILQSFGARPDDTAIEQFATVEETVRLGADAMAVVAFVRGKTEAQYLRMIAENVREGARWEMPIICHVYPRDQNMNIVYTPEDIAWAVHCIVEVGVDVVKVPYSGDPAAHGQIVADCPVPLVAAGGPRTPTFRDALQLMSDAVGCGVRGGVIGRNIWGEANIAGALRAFKAVIHDRRTIDEALKEVDSSKTRS